MIDESDKDQACLAAALLGHIDVGLAGGVGHAVLPLIDPLFLVAGRFPVLLRGLGPCQIVNAKLGTAYVAE